MNREDVAIDVTIQDVEILRNRVAELETVAQQVGDLLAVIHRDGGHYQDEHGIAKAIIDAKEVVNQDRIDLNEWQHAAETADSGAKKLADYAVQLEGKIASKHPEQAGGDERAAFEQIHTVPRGIMWSEEESQYVRVHEKHCPLRTWNSFVALWAGWQARAALAQPSPVRSSLLINGYQLRAALDFIAPDGTAEQLESEACIEWRQQDADFLEAGLYAFCAEYPEEGGVLLDEEPTTAQPSPLQSEQAEAERPEVVAYADPVAFATFKERGHEGGVAGREWMWAEPGAALVAMSRTDECERIVGALRAKADQLREALEWRKENQAGQRELLRSVTAERDAALARVAELERQEPVDVPGPGPDEIHQMAFEEGQPAEDGDGYLFSAEEFDLFVQRLLDSCATPVAWAQHSVPVVTPEMVMAAMAVFRLDVSPFKSMEAALTAALRKAAAPGKEGV